MTEEAMPTAFGWPSSLQALPSIEKFVPPSLAYAKRTAKLLLEALQDKWSAEFKLHQAQKTLACAYGLKDWFELEQLFKRQGTTPSKFDHELSERGVHDRYMQHTAAIVETCGIHGKWAYDVASVARLTASPQDRRNSRDNDSPWGQVYEREELAPGIVEVSTASHGGILLSAERQAAMPAHLRLEGAAYEEDCNHSLVVIGFPEVFSVLSQAYALSTLHVISHQIPRLRETGCEHEKFLEKVQAGYVKPDADPSNRAMTSHEEEVVQYLVTCVKLNRKPCVMTTRSAFDLADWARLLSAVPKVEGAWPMQDEPFFHNWLRVVGIGVDEVLEKMHSSIEIEDIKKWGREYWASPVPHPDLIDY